MCMSPTKLKLLMADGPKYKVMRWTLMVSGGRSGPICSTDTVSIAILPSSRLWKRLKNGRAALSQQRSQVGSRFPWISMDCCEKNPRFFLVSIHGHENICGDFRQFLDVFGFTKLAHPGFPPWIPLRNSSISTEPPPSWEEMGKKLLNPSIQWENQRKSS